MSANLNQLASQDLAKGATTAAAAASAFERHFSPDELAEMWSLSPEVVRELFKREPGVLVLGNDGGRGKRGYHTLRIPESVVERVHRRLCNL